MLAMAILGRLVAIIDLELALEVVVLPLQVVVDHSYLF